VVIQAGLPADHDIGNSNVLVARRPMPAGIIACGSNGTELPVMQGFLS